MQEASGTGIGFDIYGLRDPDAPWLIANVTTTRVERTKRLRTQHFFELEGEAEELAAALHARRSGQR